MRKIFLGLVLSLVFVIPARADWQFGRHDCASPQAYFQSNANAFAVVIGSVLSAGPQKNMLPDLQAWGSANYVGVGISVLKGFVTLGITPVGTANIFLGLVCLHLEDVQNAEPTNAQTS